MDLRQGELDFTVQESFFNTIESSGFDLEKFEKRAKSLEYFILARIFKKGKELSPFDVLTACLALNYPTKESSIRRALHNLCSDKWGHALVKTGNRVLNLKFSAVANHTYKLK